MKTFKYCPSCKSEEIYYDGFKELKCNTCSFIYFHNVAAAAAAMLEYEGKILFIRRQREPRKGKLDLPGGFIDPDESAEEGLIRELKEELGIVIQLHEFCAPSDGSPAATVREHGGRATIPGFIYLGSSKNTYEYKGITYNTCDMLFYSKIETLPTQLDKAEIASIELIEPHKVDKDDIAFISTQKGIELLIKNNIF